MRWQRAYYQWLCRIAPGPMAELNRIAVVLQAEGAAQALRELNGISEQPGLRSLPLYHALLGEIHLGLGDREQARMGFETAAGLSQSEAGRKVLREKAEWASQRIVRTGETRARNS